MRKQHSTRQWLVLGALTGCALVTHVSGCGGSGATASGGGLGQDGGLDGTSDGAEGSATSSSSGASEGGQDSATSGSSSGGDAAEDVSGEDVAEGGGSSGGDAGSDGNADAGDGFVACTPGSACVQDNGTGGICGSDGTCGACDSGGNSTGPDSSCTAAYGGTGNPYACAAGTCVAGNCSGPSDTYCASLGAGTPTCGFATPNVCGGCTSDGDCPSGDVCVAASFDAGVTRGACIAANQGGCGAAASNTSCPANPEDECCSGSCYSGNCCILSGSPTGCAGMAGTTCAANTPGETTGGGVCTSCTAVSGEPHYFVDPEHGDDTAGTGNGTQVGCAFKTITRALAVIGSSPLVGTEVIVLGGTLDAGAPVPVSAGEHFPIALGSNVTLTSQGGPVVVEVPSTGAGEGFVLSGNPSTITSGTGAAITIDGQNAAKTGLIAISGSASVAGISVQGFASAGILVATTGTTAAALTIGAGTSLSNNAGDGLLVQSGTATATGTSASTPILFNGNGMHGIRVTGSGVIAITGHPGATPPSTSDLVLSGNTTAGVWVENTTATTQSSLTGVVSTAGAANGIRIIPGSSVKVRGSWVLGNTDNGIDVENSTGSSTTVTNIDLGAAAGADAGGDAGQNTVQTTGSGANGGAGICFRLPTGTLGVTLKAEGNVFGAADCATTASTLVVGTNHACGGAGGVDVGGTISATTSLLGNKVDVTRCSYP